MAHARKQIRDAVAALLALPGYHTTTGRSRPSNASNLPAILVYTPNESADPGNSSREGLDRSLDLVIEAIVLTSEDAADDDLDAVAVLVESVVNYSTPLPGVHWCRLTRTTIDLESQGDITVGVLTLTFDVYYRTVPASPETLT